MARTVVISGSVADPGTLQRTVKLRANSIIRNRLEQVGKEMVANANALMAGDFDLNRPYDRRRHPGSRRASTALDYAISGNEDRLVLGFRVLGGDEVFKRILGMNFGTGGGHEIYPSGAWPLKRSTRAVLAWPGPDGVYRPREGSVWHPGTAGTGFLEEARDVAADALKARIVA
jgi:hypothetical protein